MCLLFVFLHCDPCLDFKSNQKLKSPYGQNIIARTRVFSFFCEFSKELGHKFRRQKDLGRNYVTLTFVGDVL